MLLTKVVLKYIFVKLQDFEKKTEFNFLLGLPTDFNWRLCTILANLAHFIEMFHRVWCFGRVLNLLLAQYRGLERTNDRNLEEEKKVDKTTNTVGQGRVDDEGGGSNC